MTDAALAIGTLGLLLLIGARLYPPAWVVIRPWAWQIFAVCASFLAGGALLRMVGGRSSARAESAAARAALKAEQSRRERDADGYERERLASKHAAEIRRVDDISDPVRRRKAVQDLLDARGWR